MAVRLLPKTLPEVSPWEYAWHFMGPAGDVVPAPVALEDEDLLVPEAPTSAR
jgi:hypothetical protein